MQEQDYLTPKKSAFNRIIGDSGFEIEFAKFLEQCDDVASYAKNYLAVYFKLDYQRTDGNISNYYPDFFVKLTDGRIMVVETKGQEDLDVPKKMERLKQWCKDANTAQSKTEFGLVYAPMEDFEKYKPRSFREIESGFNK